MVTKLQLSTKLDQRLMMSQQLKQAITLLQYSTIELSQVIKQYVETNPLLETAEDSEEREEKTEQDIDETQDNSYILHTPASKNQSYDNNESALENYSLKESLRQHLFQQTLLCHFNERQQAVAEAIIDAIEDNGRLVTSTEEIQRTLEPEISATAEEIEKVLKVIQTFDPSGVGARSISECLLIQLQTTIPKNTIWELAKSILLNANEMDGSLADTKKWLNKINTTTEEYAKAAALIRGLHLDPGVQFSSGEEIIIEPELYVKKVNGKWKVFLLDKFSSKLKLNTQYQAILKENKKNKSFASMNAKLQEAKWFLNGLQRRNETLLKVAEYIMTYQHDFLDKGTGFIRPMNIIDVSSRVNMHESTVSRVTNGKYIATPWGMFELKYFLPSHIDKKDGSSCSSLSVKEIIKQIIGEETTNHILSDDDIANRLKEQGIKIARRTIAKYREAMNILPSYQRAQIKFHTSG